MAVGTPCSSTYCPLGGIQDVYTCDSASQCVVSHVPCPGGFNCLFSCFTSCTSNGYCRSGYECDTLSHTCHPMPDAGVPDSSPPDAPIPDARVPDARVPDARVPDARVPDARVPDAAVSDARVADAATPPPDARVIVKDAAPTDARPAAQPDAGGRVDRGDGSTIAGGGCSCEIGDPHARARGSGWLLALLYFSGITLWRTSSSRPRAARGPGSSRR
jgi:hypothetical protein